MSIYENGKQTEIPIYGSDRTGTYSPPQDTIINPTIFELKRGYKRYELKDHLGNVRVTVSDSKRVAFVSETLVFSADIKTYTDYYAFGMEMVGRNWSEGEAYRFGHNGQEKSKEVGEDNYTAEFWEYDSQTARRFNLDPKPNPAISGYAVFALNPIWFFDVKGDTIINYDALKADNARKQVFKLAKECSDMYSENFSKDTKKAYNAKYKMLQKKLNEYFTYFDAAIKTEALIDYYRDIDPDNFNLADNGRISFANTYKDGVAPPMPLNIYLTTSEKITGNHVDGQTIAYPKFKIVKGEQYVTKIYHINTEDFEQPSVIGVKISVNTSKEREGEVLAHELGHYFDIIANTKRYLTEEHPRGGCQEPNNRNHEFVRKPIQMQRQFTEREQKHIKRR